MIYQFGQYELDTLRYELRHAGVAIHVLPKAFDLLVYLVQRHGQIVSKEDLFSHLWPDQFVSESALTYYIATVRKAIGDSGQHQALIKTVYSRGYRFIAPVQVHDPDGVGLSETDAPPEVDLAMADDAALVTAPMEPHIQPADERRQVTALWVSLVAASTSGAALDPEDRYESIRHAQSVCRDIIEQLGGYPVQDLSYGLLAYFGYPISREDDVRRAVRIGMRLVQAVQQLSQDHTRTHDTELTARVALHSGVVVIKPSDREHDAAPLALGDVPHMAVQLASLAGPNTLVLSAATTRLVEGYFLCDNKGDYFLEELAQSTTLYEVVGESGAQSRIEAAAAIRLTPFVGREQELSLLLARWEQVQSGRGQAVLLSGDAGIGKSRLVHMFYEHTMESAAARIEGRCFPSTQHHAFYPIAEHLQRLAAFDRGDSPNDKWLKLTALREPLGLRQDDIALLAASLFSLKPPDQHSAPLLSPQQQKQKTLEALLTWLLHEAEAQPLCLVIEDLHWADPSTLDFLSLLIEHVPTACLLILLTFRSEFESRWEMRSYMAPLALSRLTHQQVDRIILEVSHGKTLPIEIVEQLRTKTDGVPLFIEEMTRMVLESGLVKEREAGYELVDALEPLTVPSTLHDSLVARLDRLGTGKHTAQLAAAIGREFSYDLIRNVADIDEVTLQQELIQLVDVEILYQRGLLPNATFLFKHALIQEAAYQSLLRTARRQYHRRIVLVLEEQFPETREAHPELLAYHYMEAGQYQASADYWQRAASQAFERIAFLDAEAHVQQGLSAVAKLTDTSQRDQYELNLQTLLAAVLRFTKSYGSLEVIHVLRRAQELCEQVGDIPQLFNVIRSLWLSYIAQGQLTTTCELGEHLIELAQQQQEPALIMEAHRDMGTSRFFLGEQTLAAQHFEQSRQHNHQRSSPRLTILHGQGAEETTLLSYLAWNQWLRGYPDQAFETMDEALRLAHQPDRIENFTLYDSQCFALLGSATLHLWCRKPEDALPQVEASLALADKLGSPLFKLRGLTLQGRVLVQLGQHEAGIALIQRGLAHCRAQGAVLTSTFMLAMLAESYGHSGEFENGLSTISEALDLVHTHDERWWEADLYRLRAELRLRRHEPDVIQVANDLQRALAVAREQEAKSLELRAATSLAGLWQQQDKRQDAYNVLAPVYEWFTEGFDTADLKGAHALLTELT
ncbi:AAA family ATPase [Candidatus Entotheonella palauensis]|uniref:AAA family ATPase n=1 Tax=Candidatus Entotheonella palauensis TaxID=93172 RepID=UPI000B7F434E|nr:AAA family ATPase [Candidatus Entotheonella palauensis]